MSWLKLYLFALLALSSSARAAGEINAADVSWMMVATTLVLFMTIPGIALFYAGMVRKKNVLSVVMQSFAICCAVTIVWYAVGYSLAFSGGNWFVGNFDNVFLKNIQIDTVHDVSDDVCHLDTCSYVWCLCRTNQILRPFSFHDFVVSFLLRTSLSLGMGR